MKNSRDQWLFHKLPGRECLNAQDAIYWKQAFKKILKVGIEFEFNLPEKKNGTCKGDNALCPCIFLTPEKTCWQECIHKEHCNKFNKSTAVCKNVTGTCEDEDCETCEHFEIKCNGILCPHFVSKCFMCNDYKVDCTNCKYKYDPKQSPDNIRKNLRVVLKPNNTYGQVNSSGVHSIITDGSLLGKKGAEIITVGRRVDYWEFYRMAERIIDEAVQRGGYANERCSVHMHVLASYYGKIIPDQENRSIPNKVTEMERDLPEIVLANLHQLVRRYQNAMTWMTMGLDTKNHLTRWEKFRVSVLSSSALLNKMSQVKMEVSNKAGGNKYSWINYNAVQFSHNGDINRFHVEFRAADGLLAPSAIGCMYYALVIKAIEISRYGIVEIGSKEWFNQASEIKSALLNNMKSYQDGDRFGDTSKLHHYYDILIEESLDLVRQLKAILIDIGPAYEVLEKLAEQPCALRRCDGHDWKKIEKDLAVIVTKEGQMEIALSEIITLNQVSECSDETEWICTAGALLRDSTTLGINADDTSLEEKIKNYCVQKQENGELVWSNSIGAPILI